ncbi:hypothetical protein SIN07_01665 [Pediococcus inopinatus]|uniref:Lipoprotein n=1 Tax=Pediococcus inopinatus TaxID=114090 RepID=A0ABZ0Q399_9LACO|nr:hypothetical protein [Pediococcus inopinatus]AVL00561.1 hypothetical protein PI20285_07910 [Pediococcus inopinatus]KRN62479.1 hypothetical protein IV83_GL000201 [Pediococcus inopinatus]WPC17119.1 hypothetical protein N6G94_08000 [Pediococcus inopinatus]WPC19764.1 hypothetical protein N6G95_00785 [Pediococcus inopinatus]WPC21458.1 hypothetical protein N6G96_09360 [Pediococcus inopinatus]
MTLQLKIKKSLVGVVAVLMLVSLAACSSTSKQSGNAHSSSTSSKSEKTNQQKAAVLYMKAQKQIEDGKTDNALATLKSAQKLDETNGKVSELLSNVQNYLAAKEALNNGDTTSANSSLAKITSEQANSSTLKSQAKSLGDQATQLQNAKKYYQNAYDAVSNGYYETATADLALLNNLSSSISGVKALQDQGKALTSQINSATSNSSASQNSSSSTTTSSSSEPIGNLTDKETDSVISSFQSAAGIANQAGLSYGVNQIGTNYYQIEVRQNNSSNTVGSLTGMYRYNAQTGSVSKLNTISGVYEK